VSPEAFVEFAGLHPQPMLLLGLDGAVVAANPAAERFFGRPTLAGSTLGDLVDDDAERTAEVVRWFAQSSRPSRARLNLRAAEGLHAVAAAGALVSDGETAYVYVRLLADSGVTVQFRRLGARLGEVEREFGQQIRVRDEQAEEVARERVEQAQEVAREKELRLEAERATQLKDEFLATVAHELRSPLNGIVIWSQLLRDSSDPDMISDGTASILRSAHQLSQLVDDLLDMSRIVTGNLRLELGPVDLESVVREAWEVVHFAADEKQVRLEHRIQPDARLVWGDADRLRQIVWNLLSNAIKFTGPGTAIQLTSERVGPNARLVVHDLGEGLAAKDLPFVFDRFRQACDGRRRNRSGLGLGLAIVRHLAELHEGTASVRSDGPGKGSTFTVELPVAVVDSDVPEGTGDPDGDEEDDDVAEPEGRTDERILAGASVLLVEDHAEARAVLARLFRQVGAKVHAASSVEEALRALEEETFDVLVSDIAMPDRSGYDLARALRSHPRREVRELPAVAVTAHNSSRERRLALEAGFQSHVVKPLDPRELLRVLGRLTPPC
jgi:signal transduction histidine kinase/ActR/RegA family two-component response regulator